MPRALVQRLAATTVAVIGLVLVVLGIWGSGAFTPADTLVGKLPQVSQPAVVTVPGMTDLSGDTLRVRATAASGRPVFIGVGRDDDVAAYLGGAARAEVTGLGSDGVLLVTARPGQPSLPDPAGVDVWAAAARGSGEATLTWPHTTGRWQVVIATDGTAAPSSVELEWSGAAATSPAPALIAIGVLLLVVGLVALFVIRSGNRAGPGGAARESSQSPAPQPAAARSRAGSRAGSAGSDSRPDDREQADPQQPDLPAAQPEPTPIVLPFRRYDDRHDDSTRQER